MRGGAGRVGGVLAVVLSGLWAAGAAVLTGVGVVLLLSGRDSEPSVDPEGFLEFIGISVVVVGGTTLAAAIAGIVLGRRTAKGRGSSSLGLAALFVLFSAVSAMFLASAVADETGVDWGALALFGLNTAACVAVLLLALVARRS